MEETLAFYGGAVKALGGGKVGGYLVLFSGPTTPTCKATTSRNPQTSNSATGENSTFSIDMVFIPRSNPAPSEAQKYPLTM